MVTVNGLVSSCMSNNCSFEFTDAQTPKVFSTSPASGHGGNHGSGTLITIIGSGFSNTMADNEVTINGASCIVASSHSTSITCNAGKFFNFIIKTIVNGPCCSTVYTCNQQTFLELHSECLN